MTSLDIFKQAKAEAATRKPPALSNLITVVYGDKKVGKSTFASRFDSPLFIDCEDALRSVVDASGKPVARVEVNTWNDIVEITKALAEHSPKQTGFKTIVVDGMQEAFQYLRSSVLKEHNVQHENDGALAYGKGKGIIARSMRDWFIVLRKLTSKGYGVVLTAHSRILEFDNNGTKYDKRVPLVSGGKDEWGWEIIKPSVDLIVYAYKKETRGGTVHMMSTKGTQLYEAADPTADARLPHEVNFSYAELAKAYDTTK